MLKVSTKIKVFECLLDLILYSKIILEPKGVHHIFNQYLYIAI